MNLEQKIKNMSTKELAKFLAEFACAFYTERIQGICDIECNDSKCEDCIEKWLLQDKLKFKE